MDRINARYGATGVGGAHEVPVSSAETGIDKIRELRQILTSATRTLNQVSFAGQGREVTFSVDTVTKRPIVRIVDTESKEVVAQWPPEYLLRMAEELKPKKRNSG